MEEHKDNYHLETEDGEEIIPIEVTWWVTYRQERHIAGDFVAWNRWHDYKVDQVRRTDTDDVYEPGCEEAHEDWHYYFDAANLNGDIQAS